MSDSNHSEEHQEFASEEARQESVKVGISRIVDKLPFKHSADLTRRDVVTRIAEKFVEAGLQIKVSDRGWILATDKSGAQVDLTEQVSEALLTDKNLVDEQSVSAAVASGALGVEAKSDLRTVRQKVLYIDKFGQAAFERLPLQRAPKPRTTDLGHMSGKEYRDLPRSERIRISGEIGWQEVEKILSRK
jgi:hypothetical protein